VHAALPDPLPFRTAAFDFVVAGLSLHYFRWSDTQAILREIDRVLRSKGALLFRVNSSEDVAHGAGQGEQIEPQLFAQQGRYKRFFTQSMCKDLFDEDLRLEALLPGLELRYGLPKPTWMGIARKRT
jgi:SAM-dependent methyltransferase